MLPSFKIATLENNLATKVNDCTVVVKFQGMEVSGLRRVWAVDLRSAKGVSFCNQANQDEPYMENIVPIMSAAQFLHGEKQWRLLMPSSPFLALIDIHAGDELSFAYGFEEYWGQWGQVRRDGLGVKSVVKVRTKRSKQPKEANQA